jgi:3-oxoacyl-[acyl-carrier protein] reductase
LVTLAVGRSVEEVKPGFAAIASTKSIIVTLSKAFAAQGMINGVQINGILPGTVMSIRRMGSLISMSVIHNIDMHYFNQNFLVESHIPPSGWCDETAELIAFPTAPSTGWLSAEAIRKDLVMSGI